MEFMDCHQAAQAEAELVVEAARALSLTDVIPTCPGWTVDDLHRHVVGLNRGVVRYLETGNPSPPAEEWRAWFPLRLPGDHVIEWVHDQLRAAQRAAAARRAGVGPATLYRNFPTREDLIEAVYVAEVDSLCQHALQLGEAEEPWPALVAWVRHFITYMATKRVLLDALDRESGAFRACRQALYDFGGPLLTLAQESGDADPDVSIDDVMRFVIGVTGSPFGSDGQRERILGMATAGIAARPAVDR